MQVVQELQALEQTITGLPQAANLIGSAANTAVADAQKALAGTGRAIAQGNFTEALNITVTAAQNLEKVFNETAAQVQIAPTCFYICIGDSGITRCAMSLDVRIPGTVFGLRWSTLWCLLNVLFFSTACTANGRFL